MKTHLERTFASSSSFRRCGGAAAALLEPSSSHAGARFERFRRRAVTRAEPKLSVAMTPFLGSDYLDFLTKHLFFADATGPQYAYAEAGAINGIDESNTWHFDVVGEPGGKPEPSRRPWDVLRRSARRPRRRRDTWS